MVDVALAVVDTGIAAGPEIPGHSVPIVPPGISDAIQIKRCVIAIVLKDEEMERKKFIQ